MRIEPKEFTDLKGVQKKNIFSHLKKMTNKTLEINSLPWWENYCSRQPLYNKGRL